jgi:hypothetical protein
MAIGIIEEILFDQYGAQLASTKTPSLTSLRQYRAALGSRVAQILRRRFPDIHGGKPRPAMVFRLYDGRTLIAIMGRIN